MTKTILIPTDFSVQSLNVFKDAMTRLGDTKAKVLLVHGISLSDSISDLLFFSKSQLIEKLETEEFVSSCWLMQNRFRSRIESLHVDIFTGFNVAAFNQYIEANKVDEAFLPVSYKFIRRHKRSFDLVPFIKKSSLRATEVNCDELIEPTWIETEQLAALFFNKSHVRG